MKREGEGGINRRLSFVFAGGWGDGGGGGWGWRGVRDL